MYASVSTPRCTAQEFKSILSAPSDHYDMVDELVHDARLSTTEKIQILESWSAAERTDHHPAHELLIKQIDRAQDCLLRSIRDEYWVL